MWVRLDAGEDKRLEVKLEKITDSIPVPSKSRPSSSSSNIIERDGQYIAYANGVVKDTKTGLEWKVGPFRTKMDWYNAKSWVQSLRLDGGGWRLPTMNELKGIHKKRKGKFGITPLLRPTDIRGQ